MAAGAQRQLLEPRRVVHADLERSLAERLGTGATGCVVTHVSASTPGVSPLRAFAPPTPGPPAVSRCRPVPDCGRRACPSWNPSYLTRPVAAIRIARGNWRPIDSPYSGPYHVAAMTRPQRGQIRVRDHRRPRVRRRRRRTVGRLRGLRPGRRPGRSPPRPARPGPRPLRPRHDRGHREPVAPPGRGRRARISGVAAAAGCSTSTTRRSCRSSPSRSSTRSSGWAGLARSSVRPSWAPAETYGYRNKMEFTVARARDARA